MYSALYCVVWASDACNVLYVSGNMHFADTGISSRSFWDTVVCDVQADVNLTGRDKFPHLVHQGGQSTAL